MIIAKSPLRVSFLGGGTDYPQYFKTPGKVGNVVGTTINQFVYVAILNQPKFEEFKFRFNWRISEGTNEIHEISHPVVKAVLKYLKNTSPLNISTMADLPGRSGLGSSSAFTNALLASLLTKMEKKTPSALRLAEMAIEVERNILKEAGGYQDQYHSAIGGLKHYTFSSAGTDSIDLSRKNRFVSDFLSNSMVLIATGDSRFSAKHALKTIENIKFMEKKLDEMSQIARDVSSAFEDSEISNIYSNLCEGINASWRLKMDVSKHNSQTVDELIEFGLSKGADAAKLCGAGGSGFALFLVNPERRNHFIGHFKEADVVIPEICENGTEVKII